MLTLRVCGVGRTKCCVVTYRRVLRLSLYHAAMWVFIPPPKTCDREVKAPATRTLRFVTLVNCMPRRVVPKEPSVRALPRRSGAGSSAGSGVGAGASSGIVKASRASTLTLAKAAARAVLQASGFQSGAAAEAAGARDVIAAAAVAAQAFGPPDDGASCNGSDDDDGNEPTHADSEEDSDSAVDLSALDISGADTGTKARGDTEENGRVHRDRDRDSERDRHS